MRLGLRLQILLALGVVLVASYVPLYFAVSNVTRATLFAAREKEVRDLGHAVSPHALDAERLQSLTHGVALYMILFALALFTFAYFSLTYLIVKPIEGLISSADNVARGARALTVPRSGSSEIAELGERLQKMTERLVRDESLMREKVDELTRATDQLSTAQSQLIRSERLASVGQLAAGIAHEIGNPLAAIIGMHDLMDEGLSPEEKADFLRRMRTETERINTVVRNLLDFARAEKAGNDAPTDTANLRAVIHDAFALVRPQKHFKSISLRAEVQVDAEVRMSTAHLTQLLLNLLMNAGASVWRKDPNGGEITVRVTDANDRIRIEVEDNGLGVAAEVRSTLFEPFVTTKEVGEGTGLGLSVCRGLAEGAGGTLSLDTSYAAGARFVLILSRA